MAPTASIHAFEPNPILARRLERRFRSRPEVTIRTLSLGDEAGTFVLFVPVYRRYVFDGLASLDETSAQNWLEGRIHRFDRSKLRLERIECTAVPLDDLDLAPAFVKLDIQGYEHRALLGARKTLERHRPSLLVESPAKETIAYLAALGYAPHAYDGERLLRGRAGQVNTFFLPVH